MEMNFFQSAFIGWVVGMFLALLLPASLWGPRFLMDRNVKSAVALVVVPAISALFFGFVGGLVFVFVADLVEGIDAWAPWLIIAGAAIGSFGAATQVAMAEKKRQTGIKRPMAS